MRDNENKYSNIGDRVIKDEEIANFYYYDIEINMLLD